MKKPYGFTLTFNTFSYGLQQGLLDQFLSFVLVFIQRGWAIQHSAWGSGTKWPKGYTRHTRMSGGYDIKNCTTIFYIRDNESKEESWELEIHISWKHGDPIAKIKVESSHRDSVEKMRKFAEEINKSSDILWSLSELGKKLSIEENMSGDSGE